MRKHFEDKFKGFAVALQAALLKAGKAPVVKSVAAAPVEGGEGGDGERAAKRVRTNISALGHLFIDYYLDMYIGLKGNAAGRANLCALARD